MNEPPGIDAGSPAAAPPPIRQGATVGVVMVGDVVGRMNGPQPLRDQQQCDQVQLPVVNSQKVARTHSVRSARADSVCRVTASSKLIQ